MSHSIACPGKLKPGLRHDHPDPCHTYRGTTGWIEGPIKAPETGGDELLIEAAGTKADDEYPKVAVSLDGKRLSIIQLTSEARCRHRPVHGPEGRQEAVQGRSEREMTDAVGSPW